MLKSFKDFEPRLVVEQEIESAMTLSDKAKLSLYKKSQKSGIGINILEKVYLRGYSIWNENFGGNAEQFGFDRVNSFISGGFAFQLDEDLIENENYSKNKDKSSSRFVGTGTLVAIYTSDTPGQDKNTLNVIKKIIRDKNGKKS